MAASYYKYWGKSKKGSDTEAHEYHLLAFHSLDVAAVAQQWLKTNPVILEHFAAIGDRARPENVTAWVCFFVALHDLGKFDIRFQLKASSIFGNLNPGVTLPVSSGSNVWEYWHGEYAYYWACQDLDAELSWQDKGDGWGENPGEDLWLAWKPWLWAVAGHHGAEAQEGMNRYSKAPSTDPAILQLDATARREFIAAMEALFLHPAGLSIRDAPPACNIQFLAGFCSVCDWLGSTVTNGAGQARFIYGIAPMALGEYRDQRLSVAELLLQESGLLAQPLHAVGMAGLFPKFHQPHQVQTLVSTLPLAKGLTLIEAPTGSGKTEAALAYASCLIEAGLAESIIFALPTQATANAMFDRLVEVASIMFSGPDVVLAHGKAGFNPGFIDLKRNADNRSVQMANEDREASVQCARWLSESRKRVFLGRIGVCTVDQVLVSVLPVRHRFVRGFGLGKSVLIVDEVHAYDSYMYGLLAKVIEQQRAMAGSLILLSATLPQHQRDALIKAWANGTQSLNASGQYPLISWVGDGSPQLYELPEEEKERLAKLPPRRVEICCHESADMLPDETLLDRVVVAAEEGANVVVICNLVADAQKIYAALAAKAAVPLDLFHSRFRFKDRQTKEEGVKAHYGNGENRLRGGILVATQVVEQSLDIDFDWMLTQLCPMDLFFQRLGRLHRHQRHRPTGFEKPTCTVLMPDAGQYELHKLIYGNDKAPNSRVLWRTEQLLRTHPVLEFPSVYRPMIEEVYRQECWQDEPAHIVEEYEAFTNAEFASRRLASQIADLNRLWDDNDANVGLLTREDEMSLNIVPVIDGKAGRCFLDQARPIKEFEDHERMEAIMLNTLPAPTSWQKKGLPKSEDGLIWLPMEEVNPGHWQAEIKAGRLCYSVEQGLVLEPSS